MSDGTAPRAPAWGAAPPPGQNHYKVTGEGYSTQGQLLHDGGKQIDLDEVMLPMALCADARLDGENLIGDPTEGALIVLAEKGGVSVEAARQRYPRIAEVPFDSDYKFMGTFHNMTDHQGKPVVRCFIKGAPDVLIARCSQEMVGETKRPLSAEAVEQAILASKLDFGASYDEVRALTREP